MPRPCFDAQRTNENHLWPTPENPFTLGIFAAIGRGKTSLLLYLMLNKDIYYSHFDRIILFSTVLELDKKMELLFGDPKICKSNQLLADMKWLEECEQASLNETQLPARNVLPEHHPIAVEDCHDMYDESIIRSLADHQKRTIKTYGRDAADRVLCVFEDAPALSCFSGKTVHHDRLARFMTEIRHYKCSTIMVSQQFKIVPRVVRINLTACFVARVSDKEADEIYEVFHGKVDRKTWFELYREVTGRDYGFLQINQLNNSGYMLIDNTDGFLG